jgi:hypothetical protein
MTITAFSGQIQVSEKTQPIASRCFFNRFIKTADAKTEKPILRENFDLFYLG